MAAPNARIVLVPLATLLSLACGSATPAASSPSAEQALISAASPVPSLGAAASFAVLGGTAVTCTNGTIAGNVGVSPGTAITQTSCPVTGSLDAGDAAAAEAHNEFVLAYDAFAALPCDDTTSAVTFPVQPYSAGVHCFQAAATDGTVTLSGSGPWIFKIGTLGTGALTGTGLKVVMADGSAVPCGSVFWWVAEAVTMTTSQFAGTILGGAAITFKLGAFNGNAYGKAGITITGSAVTSCAIGGSGGPPPTCRTSDFVDGGGFIRGTPSGEKGTFSVGGGIRHGKFFGHLTYEDHGRKGPEVKGQSVTAYTVLDATTRRIEGSAKVNGRSGFTYRVDVSDNGEPGRNDTFSILLSNGYSASGRLGNGNIQVHQSRACRNGDDGDDDDDDDGDDDGHDDDHGGGHDSHKEGGR